MHCVGFGGRWKAGWVEKGDDGRGWFWVRLVRGLMAGLSRVGACHRLESTTPSLFEVDDSPPAVA